MPRSRSKPLKLLSKIDHTRSQREELTRDFFITEDSRTSKRVPERRRAPTPMPAEKMLNKR